MGIIRSATKSPVVIRRILRGVAAAVCAPQQSCRRRFDFMKSIDSWYGHPGGMAGPRASSCAVLLTILPERCAVRRVSHILFTIVIGIMMVRPQGLFTFGKPAQSKYDADAATAHPVTVRFGRFGPRFRN